MKLPPAQLTQHLVKGLAPIYLIHGDETLLVEETLASIYKVAHEAGFTERIVTTTDLYTGTHSTSLFATKKIVELHLNIKLHGKIIEEYAEKPFADILLVIRSGKLDAKVEKAAWYKAIDKKGIIITLWPIPPEQLPTWIMQRAKQQQLILSKEAAEWLAEQMEGNLLAASQEIEKLSLLKPQGVLDEKSIQTMVTDSAHFDIFNLVDSALLGKTARTLRILQNLAEEGTEPTLILWALTRELRTLAELHSKMAEGAALTALFSSFRIWEKRQPLFKAALKRHPKSHYWDLIIHAAKIDHIIKGAEWGNVWNEFQLLVTKMG